MLFISAGTGWGCDMFALMLTDSGHFSDHEETVYSYFNFLIGRSSSTTNDDGYGVVAYHRDSRFLQVSDCWYKTGYETWYGDGEAEPLDDARTAILSDENDYYLVIGHARNATGGSGSHPFRLESDLCSYSFCHNGVISTVLRQAFMDYLGEFWFDQYPSNWSGEFGDLGSFIDSELYMHYLINSIFNNGNEIITGFQAALQETNLLGINPADYLLNARCSGNFLFSDGIDLYAFRNTKLTSSYKLSWQDYDNMIGIKTHDLLITELEQNELVQFTATGEINSQILEAPEEEEFVPPAQFYAQPNPCRNYVDIFYSSSRKDDNNNDDINESDFVTIYDIKGRKLREISSSLNAADFRCYHWDGRSSTGKRVAAGIYIFQHHSSGKTGKLVLIK